MSVITDLIRELRMAAAKAKWTRDRRTGLNNTMVYMAIPQHVALLAAKYLELIEDRNLSRARAKVDMSDITGCAEEALKDNALRFTYAIHDLEMLLMEFIGRPPMTMQEVREQRQIMESRPSPGPQPFIRKKSSSIPVSDSLARSIRENRIGNPREPGEDG